jgi:uncharacterized membrane protein
VDATKFILCMIHILSGVVWAGAVFFLTAVLQPALRHGELGVTSTPISDGAKVEIARRQPDGARLWVIDQPNILR